MREAIILMFVLPALILAGMVIYVLIVYLGPSHTYTPIATVQFNSEDYIQPLSLDDFRPFGLFENVDCGECRLDVFPGPQDFSSLTPEGGVGVRIGRLHGDPVNDLAVTFYGEDQLEVKAVIRQFIRYLDDQETFDPGFELYDNIAESTVDVLFDEWWFGRESAAPQRVAD